MTKNDHSKFQNYQLDKKLEADDIFEENKIGIIIDCFKLNVRKSPMISAEIVCEIPNQTEVMINEKESTDDFYKICTASGIEGFCMRKHISIK